MKKGEAVKLTWHFSLNGILEHVEQLSNVPVQFMYSNKMKAQTDENSTTEISLYTRSLTKDSF